VKSASAQDYPARPVRVIVGYPAGGTTDIVARLTAHYLATALGQNVVVENRTGATGLIAVDAVARSPADGYTLLVVSNAEFSVVPALRPKLPFDPLKDFAPLALLASVPLLYVVPASVPAKTMSDLVALAKQRPGSIRYGSSGIGGVLHLAGEMLKHRAGIDMVHVPYKGGGELLAAALGGQIEMIAIGSASVSRHLASGELRALAVASEKRLDALPGIPTMMESGFPGFVVPSWWGIAAPAGVPVPILERLSRELVALARSAPFRSRVEQLGGVAEPLAREGFAELIARDIAQWRQLGAATGIKLEG
jgi:tripartite-type tricarboxylate transporter receptor subunit TctC